MQGKHPNETHEHSLHCLSDILSSYFLFGFA